MTDADRERLIEAWRTVLALEIKPTAKTRARWALLSLEQSPPVQTDSQSAVPVRAGRIL